MTSAPKGIETWLTEGDRAPAAISIRTWLRPVEGADGVVFPPTFAPPEGAAARSSGYVIDRLPTGAVCLMDSVGSQSNRMEAIFKSGPYSALVPQVIVEAGSKSVNLLDAGHRAADAIVRYSQLSADLKSAFSAWRDTGDAMGLAKLAPTSLVFGVWDSRETQAKVPRLVSSTIRAFDVVSLNRGGQYLPAVDYVAENLVDPTKVTSDDMSTLGLAHQPLKGTSLLGGVMVRGGIRRDAVLSLIALRDLRASDTATTLALRRYVLGLGLVALTAPQRPHLRQGCILVPDPSKAASSSVVFADGREDPFTVTHAEALRLAEESASAFGVGASRTVKFSPEKVTEGKAARAKKSKPKSG